MGRTNIVMQIEPCSLCGSYSNTSEAIIGDHPTLGNSTISRGVRDRNGDEGREFDGDAIDGNTSEHRGGLLVC
ncbi:hypothetical protein A2U01_0063299 [Trifolium medium]|uniref:Uncharacterized protein n=1 Tax=Trifolium medium TaxID=97028 RepID=A0A392S144_9FABA|nr:hypothetical protein [Trifolium medium]